LIIFRYDKTFEGLLTAVFDAYARRMWPDLLLAEGEVAPLFTREDHTVITDSEKSTRVWAALTKKLPRDVCNMLTMGWLSEADGVDMMLARYMRRVVDEPKQIYTDFSDPDILRIKQLALKVSYEREHLMQFTRFQKGSDLPGRNADGDSGYAEDASGNVAGSYGAGATYFAPVSPRYNALPLAIPYFRDRFRDQKWLIYDIKRHYGYYYDLHEVTEITMEDDAHLTGELDPTLLADDEKLFQNLWCKYIDSMAIAERINPRLQRQHMPRRFWPLLTEMKK
jgi:probable DNA metabolism protein